MTTSFLRCPLNSAASTSARAAITRPSVVRDLFMFPPSRRRVPVAPEELARSLPAKSTNLNQHFLHKTGWRGKRMEKGMGCVEEEGYRNRDIFSTVASFVVPFMNLRRQIVKTAWDREDVSFINVAAVVRTFH